MTLTVDDFGAWMRAVHGQEPFPWQARLLREVRERGWPAAIKLPTASGKTTALDVAIFALALEAVEGPARRRMPLRVAFVVDRRIVVDGAFARAERVREALASPASPVVSEVARALASFGGERPLHTALLRGGIYREDRWARQPNQPTVLCSTVDQVGSRLLHRGYGIAPATWPIHAGLLGNDTLLLLDEAHCSDAFLQTLEQLRALRARHDAALGLPFAVTAMTATPRDGTSVFELDEADLAHPVLRRRLAAPRPTSLVVASGRSEREFVSTMRDLVCARVAPGGTLLAVVNRVRSARALHGALAKLPAAQRPGLLLLTGRARPIERDRLLQAHAARLMAGRDRAAVADAPALVVVATQCVEVGADLDVDTLVTEACPLDALRQRLGRVNRLGVLDAAACAVVSRQELAWSGEGDPPLDAIYGASVAETWRWLVHEERSAPIDGGVLALAARAEGHDPKLDAPKIDAPTMFPVYCDLWAQTGPAPAASPEPSVFLHGPQRAHPEVQVVWRADLDALPVERWADAVALCPPVAGETLALSLFVARQWLDGTLKPERDDSADVEGLGGDEVAAKEPGVARAFLCWRGLERSVHGDDPAAIGPGDTLVIPSRYGGCDAFGWQPESHDAVIDLADEARVASRRAPALRLHPSIVGGDLPLASAANEDPPEELRSLLGEAIAALAARPGATGQIAEALGRDRRWSFEPHPAGLGYVLLGRAGWGAEARDFSDEDDSSSAAPAELGLAQHLGDVRDLAGSCARAVGLSSELAGDLALAAHLHDLGKADVRFQAWLRGGDRVAATRGPALAKSPEMPASLAASRRARERAGYPRGGRHELLSVRLAESSPALLAAAHDRELVLHLVESHHGHCRPFAPVVADERPLLVQVAHERHSLEASSATGLERLDSGVGDRFFSLLRRYGWWGLSYLEACLRLADHRASERAEGGAR